ncbi:putative asparagine synthase [Mycena leptocephala]|nr:putative asparagine synthase [Mycena leptocephala]
MCGITAIYHPDSSFPPTTSKLACMLGDSLKSMNHRGPDGQGVFMSQDCRVGLGHVRLSIIDLETGKQPLADEDGSIQCVVTGEIYDHARIRAELAAAGARFKTKSDSEVVLQLYKRDGFKALSSLRGEFAFVLYDAQNQLLFAARDRFGIKPLNYTLSNGALLLASELKALPALGWKPEWDIDSIVNTGYMCDDRTVFKGVKKLMPGQFLTFRSSGELRVETYWDIEYSSATPSPPTIEEMIAGVRTRLTEAVRLRLRADVPVALYLSGGIDSAAIAGIATELLREEDPNAKLTTFTLTFPHAKDLDEGPIAARTAAHLGADAHMVELSEKELVGAFEDTVWHAEEPVLSYHGPGKFLLSKFVREKGFKVVLTGEGADEFFGGYGWFPIEYLRAPDPAGRSISPPIPLPSDAERAGIIAHIEAKISAAPRPSLSANSLTDKAEARAMLGGISTHREFAAAGCPDGEIYAQGVLEVAGEPDATMAIAKGIDERVREKARKGEWHPLHVAGYVTAKTLLAQVLLNHIGGERTEMAHSVESRPAFLDHHVVEYINSLPPCMKVRPIKGERPGVWSFTEKWLLRQAVRPYVTDELFERRKFSYNAPPERPSSSSTAPNINDKKDMLAPLPALFKNRITPEA